MIDHLEIESNIIMAESNEGRAQMRKYGRRDEDYNGINTKLKCFLMFYDAEMNDDEDEQEKPKDEKEMKRANQ